MSLSSVIARYFSYLTSLIRHTHIKILQLRQRNDVYYQLLVRVNEMRGRLAAGLFSALALTAPAGAAANKLFCHGEQKAFEPCSNEVCLPEGCLDCTWAEWGEWSACSCQGIQERERDIYQPNNECGKPCSGTSIETRSCTPDCSGEKQDCQISDWSYWSDCTETCGGGVKERTRKVTQIAKNGGKLCGGAGEVAVSADGQITQLPLKELEDCNTAACVAPKDCVYSYWGSWSECSSTCAGGQTKRKRVIESVASHGGKPCSGALEEIASCNADVSCTEDQDCVWDDWGTWTKCTKSCNGGIRQRHRGIYSAPRGNGQLCHPQDTHEVEACNTQDCYEAQDCELAEWGRWSDCSSKCNGTRERKRGVKTYPKFGGYECFGPLREVESCGYECPIMPDAPPADVKPVS